MKVLYACILTMITATVSAEEHDTSLIYFPFDKSTLTKEAKEVLEQFIGKFNNNSSGSHLMIKGHCDAKGTDGYNDLLSQRRSFAVHEYLLNNGIPKNAVALVKGYGENEPLNANANEEERQLNRRVELIWIHEAITPVTEKQPEKKLRDSIRDFSKLSIDSVKEGELLRLKNINFYGGRHVLLPQSYPALNELLDVMKKNPTLVIEIHGHICCGFLQPGDGRDIDTGEDRLSWNRAETIYNFLLNSGIEQKRMSYKGFGAARPLVHPEISEADRSANRRVEIRIISK